MKHFKIIYGILVHHDPAQFARMLHQLNNPDVCFYVHVDARCKQETFESLIKGLPVKFITNRIIPYWGSFNIVQAQLNLFKAVEQDGLTYDHFFLMSGQDYALVSNERLLEFFQAHKHFNFIQYEPDHSKISDALWKRISDFHIIFGNGKRINLPYIGKNPLKWLIGNFISIFLPKSVKKVIPKEKIFFGSNWVKLTPKAVRYILDFCLKEERKIAFFKSCLLPDELFFQTVLLNAGKDQVGEIINEYYLYSHWDRPAELYPSPLNEWDFERIDFTKKFFARKMDTNLSSNLMDLIDQQISSES